MQHTRLLRRAIFVGSIVLLLAQTIAALMIIERAREAQVRAAEETVERVSTATEASINRAFVQVDAMLAGLPAMLAPFAINDQIETAQVNRVLRQLINQNFTYRDILLLGPNGLPLATALPVSRRRRLPLPVETGFSELAGSSGGLSFGGPVQNPSTGEWTLFFSRNVIIRGMGPVLAVAEVPVPSVRALLSAAGEGVGLRTTLERDDGTLLASVPHDETRIGQRLGPVPPAAEVSQQAAIVSSRFSGRPVFLASRPALYPTLTITTTIEVDEALAGWYRDRIRALAVSTALGSIIILVALALMVILRQRDKAEEERARARRTLENALESMSDGFVMFDADDRLIACNSRYKDFYRLSAPFIQPGNRFEDFMREGAKRGQYPQAGDDIEAFVAESKAFHLGNQPPMERLLPDGRWVLITERRTPDGGTVGIRTDITALKHAMDELAAAREAKSRFLARVSHELRTPLNGVLGFAQVLLQDPRLGPEQREQVKTLHEAGRHLLDLVNGLLDLSKIEAGRLDLAPQPTAIRPLFNGCATLLEPEVTRKAQSFSLDIDAGLPAAAHLDPTRIRQSKSPTPAPGSPPSNATCCSRISSSFLPPPGRMPRARGLASPFRRGWSPSWGAPSAAMPRRGAALCSGWRSRYRRQRCPWTTYRRPATRPRRPKRCRWTCWSSTMSSPTGRSPGPCWRGPAIACRSPRTAPPPCSPCRAIATTWC
jgi:signal transduction histidine kinase